MLQITDIYKEYRTGTLVQKALDGVSLSFRENEFVAILGPSGSGKTTLLNIIGGLDHCDSGELMIDGVPTARYKSRDWDAYRNHSVGFIFQSYNLIPHQTLLRNVELALILSGVSAKERRLRAEEELDRVGLKEQMRKKPAQLSGGQMQRVAIARALVNHPTIVLADEPTGALDSDTGEQVMQLLKEVAQDHLVVMVTHNPDLAERYANRIIRLRDGKVVSDSNPYDPAAPMVQKETAAAETSEPGPAAQIERSAAAPAVSLPAGSASAAPAKRIRKPSMSFLTALSLSVSNLLSKKARTILVAFAASIGITGIALILSLSTGAHSYISRMEEEALSEYPLQITSSSFSMDASMQAVAQLRSQTREADDGEGVREQQILGSMLSGTSTNDLKSLKNWFDSGYSGIEEVTRSVSYSYGISPLVYLKEEKGYRQVNPDQTMSTMGISVDDNLSGMMSLWSSNDAFCMLPAREELYQDSYKVLAGHWPQNASECVLVLLPGGRVPDYLLYSMGLKDAEELNDMITGVMTGEAVDTSISSNGVYDPQEFLGISFKLLPASRRFSYDKKLGVWLDRGDNEAVLNDLLDNAKDLVIAGVVMPDDEKALGIVQIGIDFLPEAMEELIAEAEKSPVVQAQLADPQTDVLTGSPFGENTDDPFGGMADMIEIHPENMPDAVSVDLDRLPEVLDRYGRLSAQETVRVLRELRRTGESPTLQEAVEELIPALMSLFVIDENKIGELISFEMDEARMQEMYAARASAGESSLKGNLTRFGYADPESPGMITIYPKDFESKDQVIEILESYNRAMEKEGQEDKVITYTDYVGSLMSSVTTIIDVITYVLIAFVAVSLVVSSIMIRIITYISVLERRK
jgi:putative ABC transport system permease protein